MPSPSDYKIDFTPDERRDFGFIRVKDIAFDAVQSLWRRRQKEGMTQADLAAAINADTGWVSKNLRGPGNWTLRTFGAFVEGLRGEAAITLRASEDPVANPSNWHIYVDYDADHTPIAASGHAAPVKGRVVLSGSGTSKGAIVTTLVP